MTPFETASRIEPTGDAGRFRAVIPDGWQQGRGAFGGLVIGTLARAMLQSEPDAARVLRALNAELCGPVLPGEAQLTVRVLRRGKGMSTVEAHLDQGDAVLARASAILGASRSTVTGSLSPPPPTQPPWSGVATASVEPPFGPVFAGHYEYRPVGPLPFSSAAEPVASGYVRAKQPQARLDAPAILAYLDTYWPAYFSIVGMPSAMATVNYTAELLADPGALASDEPLFHTGRLIAHAGGFMVELRELWSGSLLVALNQQTFAVI